MKAAIQNVLAVILLIAVTLTLCLGLYMLMMSSTAQLGGVEEPSGLLKVEAVSLNGRRLTVLVRNIGKTALTLSGLRIARVGSDTTLAYYTLDEEVEPGALVSVEVRLDERLSEGEYTVEVIASTGVSSSITTLRAPPSPPWLLTTHAYRVIVDVVAQRPWSVVLLNLTIPLDHLKSDAPTPYEKLVKELVVVRERDRAEVPSAILWAFEKGDEVEALILFPASTGRYHVYYGYPNATKPSYRPMTPLEHGDHVSNGVLNVYVSNTENSTFWMGKGMVLDVALQESSEVRFYSKPYILGPSIKVSFTIPGSETPSNYAPVNVWTGNSLFDLVDPWRLVMESSDTEVLRSVLKADDNLDLVHTVVLRAGVRYIWVVDIVRASRQLIDVKLAVYEDPDIAAGLGASDKEARDMGVYDQEYLCVTCNGSHGESKAYTVVSINVVPTYHYVANFDEAINTLISMSDGDNDRGEDNVMLWLRVDVGEMEYGDMVVVVTSHYYSMGTPSESVKGLVYDMAATLLAEIVDLLEEEEY